MGKKSIKRAKTKHYSAFILEHEPNLHSWANVFHKMFFKKFTCKLKKSLKKFMTEKNVPSYYYMKICFKNLLQYIYYGIRIFSKLDFL